LARLLVASAQVPLTSTSANLSGNESCSSAAEVEKQLGDVIDSIIDGGTTEGLLPSTILDLTKTPPQVVREGIIGIERLQPFIG
jgi:L-threonylcarbamoyladenylate synthase